jgi:glycosyltransferase 2 family protein
VVTSGVPGDATSLELDRRWRLSRLQLGLFLGGSALFAWLIRRVGAAAIAGALSTLGPGLLLVIGVESLAVLANTWSWRWAIPPEHRRDVPFRRLMAARIAGDAVGYVIPGGAGEIAKFKLLSRYVPGRPALGSVALAKLTEGIALGLFGVLGLALAWRTLATGAVAGETLAGAVLLGVGLVVGGLAAARFELVPALSRLLQGVGAVDGDRASRWSSATPADGRAVSERPGLIRSTAWHLVGWLVNVVELWLACHFLGLHPPATVVFSGEALGVLLDCVFFFVPMRIGAAEGGRVFVLGLLGFGASAALTLGLVRRIRELAWTGAGLAIYPWLARGDGAAARPGRDGDAVAA